MVRHSWRTELRNATSEPAVLGVVARFLGEWSQGEIASLPPGAWARRPRSKPEVLAHAARLAEMHGRFVGDPRTLSALQELLLFYTHAAVRIARLSALDTVDDCPARDSRLARNAKPATRIPNARARAAAADGAKRRARRIPAA